MHTTVDTFVLQIMYLSMFSKFVPIQSSIYLYTMRFQMHLKSNCLNGRYRNEIISHVVSHLHDFCSWNNRIFLRYKKMGICVCTMKVKGLQCSSNYYYYFLSVMQKRQQEGEWWQIFPLKGFIQSWKCCNYLFMLYIGQNLYELLHSIEHRRLYFDVCC